MKDKRQDKHEFISSIVEGREPAINAVTMKDGEGVYLPTFELL